MNMLGLITRQKIRGNHPSLWSALSVGLSLGCYFLISTINTFASVDLIVNGDAESGTTENFSGWEYASSDCCAGAGCFVKTGNKTLLYEKFIPVEPSKFYSQSVALKSSGTAGLNKVRVGLSYYDKDSNRIGTRNYYHALGTETSLAQDVKQGDVYIYLRASSESWYTGESQQLKYVAFFDEPFYAAQGRYYYTQNVVPYDQIEKVDANSQIIQLKLPTAWNKATVKQGTPVANTQDIASYQCACVNLELIPATWVYRSGIITGIARPDELNANRFFPGTAFVKPIIVANYSTINDPGYTVRMDNLSLSELGEYDVIKLNNGKATLTLLGGEEGNGLLFSLKSNQGQQDLLAQAMPLSYLAVPLSSEPGDTAYSKIFVRSLIPLGNHVYSLRYGDSILDQQVPEVDMRILAQDGYFAFTIIDTRHLPERTSAVSVFEVKPLHQAQWDMNWALSAPGSEIFMQALPDNQGMISRDLDKSYKCYASAWYRKPKENRPFVGLTGYLITAFKSEYFQALERFVSAEGLPKVTFNQRWFRDPASSYNRNSYFLLNLEDEEQWPFSTEYSAYYPKAKEFMKRGKFKQLIDINAVYLGDYNIPRRFKSKDELIAAYKAFQEAGIAVGLHTFLNRIEPGKTTLSNDSGNFQKELLGVLQESVTLTSATVTVQSTPQSQAVLAYYNKANHMEGLQAKMYLLIDHEILEAKLLQTDPGGIVFSSGRKAKSTVAAQHYAGASVFILPGDSDYSVLIAPDSPGQEQSVHSLAAFAKEAQLNLIYGDGASAYSVSNMDSLAEMYAQYLWGRLAYLRAISPALVFQSGGGSYNNVDYYYLSKSASWDGADFKNKAFTKNFKVKKCLVLNNNPYRDYTYDMGWWKIQTPRFGLQSMDHEATSLDDLHYAMAKTFAYRTFIGLEEGVGWNQHERINELLDTFAIYHRLFEEEEKGLAIPEGIYTYLQDPENEAELNAINGYSFIRKKVYQRYVFWTADTPYEFSFDNPFDQQKLKLEIRPRFDFYGYADPRNLPISDFADSSAIKITNSAGVTAQLKPGGELAISNTGSGVGSCALSFPGTFNLAQKRGVGIEVTGDGKNELILISLFSAWYPVRDFEFVPERGRKTYILADPVTDTKTILRDSSGKTYEINTDACRRSFPMQYNAPLTVGLKVYLAPGTYALNLHGIKALQEKNNGNPLVNPSIEVNGKKLTFPVTLYTDDAATKANVLEYNGYTEKYKLYNACYGFLSSGTVGGEALLADSGANLVRLNAAIATEYSQRADIRLSVYDDEDNDGIPTHGSFSDAYMPQSPLRQNFYDDNEPLHYNPNQGINVVYGDVSGDGQILAEDAWLVARYSVGLVTDAQIPGLCRGLSAEDFRRRGDVDGVAGLSANDAMLIAKRAVGLIDRFPVEKE